MKKSYESIIIKNYIFTIFSIKIERNDDDVILIIWIIYEI